MFAFGTHYTYGGDNINFGLSIKFSLLILLLMIRYTLTRNPDDTGLYLEIESLDSNNKYYTTTTKYKYTTSPNSITGFYFNGAGSMGQLTGDIRKFKFVLGDNKFENDLIAYFNLKIEI